MVSRHLRATGDQAVPPPPPMPPMDEA
jgi:hypothetical protein